MKTMKALVYEKYAENNDFESILQIKDIPEPTPKPDEVVFRVKAASLNYDDIEPSSAEQVEYAMATRFQADKDLVLIKNVRGSSLDPSSDQKNLKTAKLGIDATRPLNKRKEGFEIAEIPKINKISLNDYL